MVEVKNKNKKQTLGLSEYMYLYHWLKPTYTTHAGTLDQDVAKNYCIFHRNLFAFFLVLQYIADAVIKVPPIFIVTFA